MSVRSNIAVIIGFVQVSMAARVCAEEAAPRMPWAGGKAEVSSYELEQARYGEVHKGQAVLIFVEEPFSATKQLKIDDWKAAGSDRVDVLKLNFTQKFVTGIYPYSMMLSVFSPIDTRAHPRALKITASVQEWCGHVFSQMNLHGDVYSAANYSYFESDGDTKLEIPAMWLEDELWTRIRLAPGDLPEGEFTMAPGLFHCRLRHVPQTPVKVRGSWAMTERTQRDYVVECLEGPPRTLWISTTFTAPYPILGWQEDYPGPDGKPLRTRATLKKTIVLDYGRHHSNSDRELRKELGLSIDE
jgi:hypothetical protein